jgi:hypothetical protein
MADAGNEEPESSALQCSALSRLRFARYAKVPCLIFQVPGFNLKHQTSNIKLLLPIHRNAGSDLTLDPFPVKPVRLFQVVIGLKTHPEPLTGAKIFRQTYGRVGRNGTFFQDDLVDPPRRNPDLPGKLILAEPHRLEELFPQDLPRVDVRKPFFLHIFHLFVPLPGKLTGFSASFLVVINDLDIVRITSIPNKTYSPLVIDPDTMLPFSRPLQFFKPVSRRNQKIGKDAGIVDHTQLSSRYLLNNHRKLPGNCPLPNLIGLPAFEAFYHGKL